MPAAGSGGELGGEGRRKEKERTEDDETPADTVDDVLAPVEPLVHDEAEEEEVDQCPVSGKWSEQEDGGQEGGARTRFQRRSICGGKGV